MSDDLPDFIKSRIKKPKTKKDDEALNTLIGITIIIGTIILWISM